MVGVIVINKHCTIQEKQVDIFNQFTLNKLYSNSKNIKISCLHLWSVQNDRCIGIFGTSYGMFGGENKYELPPPVDNVLLFGNIIIVGFNSIIENIDQNNIFQCPLFSLKKNDWEQYYEYLFGGFESITNSEDETETSSDIYDSLEKTKSGYALDGFVVDDDEEISYHNGSNMNSECEYEYSDSVSDYSDSDNDDSDSVSDSDSDS